MHVLGSFIFGLPTDTPDTFDATADLAQRAGVSFAQFVMLQPFPGTVDFAKWEKEAVDVPTVNGVPADPLLADSAVTAAESLYAAPADVGGRDPRCAPRACGTSSTRSAPSGSGRTSSNQCAIALAFVLLSKLYRQMYANTGIATDSARVARSVKRARLMARAARWLFLAKPMPELAEPPFLATPPRVRAIPVRVTTITNCQFPVIN